MTTILARVEEKLVLVQQAFDEWRSIQIDYQKSSAKSSKPLPGNNVKGFQGEIHSSQEEPFTESKQGKHKSLTSIMLEEQAKLGLSNGSENKERPRAPLKSVFGHIDRPQEETTLDFPNRANEKGRLDDFVWPVCWRGEEVSNSLLWVERETTRDVPHRPSLRRLDLGKQAMIFPIQPTPRLAHPEPKHFLVNKHWFERGSGHREKVSRRIDQRSSRESIVRK